MTDGEHGVAEQISRSADALRKALDAAPRTATVRDLCRRLSPFLVAALPGATLSFAYREQGKPGWDLLDNGSPAPDTAISSGEDVVEGSGFHLDGTRRRLCVVHALADGSELALRVSRAAPAPPFTDLDLVAVRLYVHLFDGASQRLAARQTEKGLVFSLNRGSCS